MSDLDRRVRLAAFNWLADQVRIQGDVFSRLLLAEGAVRDETPEELGELKKHFPSPRDAVAYIMDTFPIVKRRDEEKHGEYRTKRVILEIYDEMAEAMRTGKPYQTRLAPPPADPRCCHPPKEDG